MDCFFACLLDYDLLDCDLYLIVRLYGTCLYMCIPISLKLFSSLIWNKGNFNQIATSYFYRGH